MTISVRQWIQRDLFAGFKVFGCFVFSSPVLGQLRTRSQTQEGSTTDVEKGFI